MHYECSSWVCINCLISTLVSVRVTKVMGAARSLVRECKSELIDLLSPAVETHLYSTFTRLCGGRERGLFFVAVVSSRCPSSTWQCVLSLCPAAYEEAACTQDERVKRDGERQLFRLILSGFALCYTAREEEKRKGKASTRERVALERKAILFMISFFFL